MNFKCQDTALAQLQALIAQSQSIVILTGAGISTESGIPDFRSPGGIWSKIQPIQFNEFVSSEEARQEDWRRRFVMNEDFAHAIPNEGHKAIKRLQDSGKLKRIITQNIDGLHQKSGLDESIIIEIHGNSTYATCLDCGEIHDLEAVRTIMDETGRSSTCRQCSGLVKAAVISFGQSMPEAKLNQAIHDTTSCDLFIVIGSSLVVYPVAALPEIAIKSGAKLAIINRDPTPLDGMAELALHEEIGPFLARL